MIHSINDGKKYTFVVKANWINDITYGDKILSNDVYTKYSASLNNMNGELIVCSDINKITGFCKKIVPETYQEYLEFISNNNFTKEQWIYNILDGISEQDKILYKDEHIVILPNYTWNGDDLSKMYLLTFPTDKKLHSIRDLTGEHIWLLEHIKVKTLELIKNMYGFDSDIVKMYFHYAPSTYHLHVHSVLISNIDDNSSVEYSHNLTSLIENIKIKPNYYQCITINKRI